VKRPWLAPLVPLYAAGAALRARLLKRSRLTWPVISVGNLSTGGAGKTPLTIALARLLAEQGIHVDVLSRGYGRRSAQALRVDVNGDAERFGDEPLLIARAASVPVYVAPQRYGAGLLAEADENPNQNQSRPNVHILDDGFQHCQLERAVDILLLNREDLADSLLPAGNLREALRAAKRADILAIPSDDPTLADALRARGLQQPVWRIRRQMQVPDINGPVLAFCGIARPDQFFAGLEAAGLQLAERRAFCDHHRYTAADIARLIAVARAAGVRALLTTEKDLVRLGLLASLLPANLPLRTAGLTAEIEDASAALSFLLDHLQSPS